MSDLRTRVELLGLGVTNKFSTDTENQTIFESCDLEHQDLGSNLQMAWISFLHISKTVFFPSILCTSKHHQLKKKILTQFYKDEN